jgi:integrase
MAPYKRRDGQIYYLDLRWRGWPRIALSTGTTTKERAKDMESLLRRLKRQGRRDLLGLLSERRTTLPELFDADTAGTLDHLVMRAESPRLGDLVDEWFEYLKSPAAVSRRTRRRLSPEGIRRYEVSWEALFGALERGRDAPLAAISQGFLADFRIKRRLARGGKKGRVATLVAPSPATLNRDLAALQSFLGWVKDGKGLATPKLVFLKERESEGRTRWLTTDEVRKFLAECPEVWQGLFATLFYTGIRLGELQGLRRNDLETLPNRKRRVSINEKYRRLKSKAAIRDVGVPGDLDTYIKAHLSRFPSLPSGIAFPGPFQNAKTVRDVWYATCEKAGIDEAKVHDCRHTYAVHMVRAGVDLVRLKALLGHASLQMVLRYAKYSDESLIDSDADRLEAGLRVRSAQETDTQPAESQATA